MANDPSKPDSQVLVIGRPGAGKSIRLKEELRIDVMKELIDRGYFFDPNAEFERLGAISIEPFGKIPGYRWVRFETITELMQEIERTGDPKKGNNPDKLITAVVIDELALIERGELEAFSRLLTQRRHWWARVYLGTQKAYNISKQASFLTTTFYVGSLADDDDINRIHIAIGRSQYPSFPSDVGNLKVGEFLTFNKGMNPKNARKYSETNFNPNVHRLGSKFHEYNAASLNSTVQREGATGEETDSSVLTHPHSWKR